MRRNQSGQSLVELAASSFVLLLFALGILGVGHVVAESMAVRSAAIQAALGAARAPSEADAQTAGRQAAQEAVQGSGVHDFSIQIDTAGFQRGGTLTATAHGCVDLGSFPIIRQALGSCVPLTSQAHALIEPFRSRSS